MANDAKPGPGHIGWIALTVPGAEGVRDCHAQGVDAGLPRVWRIDTMGRCQARGGKVLRAPKDADAGNRFRVIQDPAGAVAALVASQSGSV